MMVSPLVAQNVSEMSQRQLELERQKLEIERQQLELLRREIEMEKSKAELGFLETNETATLKLQADVLFGFGESNLREEGKVMLTKVANLIQQISVDKIYVEGHTDSRGSESVNMALSNERAEAVKAMLVDSGIDADLIVTEGLGESKPIAHNTLPDGRDFPEGRQRNRRVQIRMDKLPPEELAANTPETQVFTEDEVTLVRVQSDRVLNYETRTVEPSAMGALEKAISILKQFEGQPVELEVHTDQDPNRDGDDEQLAGILAREVEEVLDTAGVDVDRIETEGVGNARPIDYNTQPDGSDYPEGRAMNRRIEFRILTQ